MDRQQLIVTVIGLVATLAATGKAGFRLWDLWRDYRHVEPNDGATAAEQRLEVLMTQNLYRAQAVRFATYTAILALFATPFFLPSGDMSRFIRSVISIMVLIAFASEEFYLDRARDRWLSNIRKERVREAALGNQRKLLEVAESNKLALEEQRELAASALEEQTELTDTARANRDALEEQHKRERKSGP